MIAAVRAGNEVMHVEIETNGSVAPPRRSMLSSISTMSVQNWRIRAIRPIWP
jgi:hypothetical protein